MNEKTMNMNLEEFTEHVAEKLKTKMPQLEIKTVQQEKNNGVSKWGIRMGKIKNGEGWSASPIVYLDDIYSRVQKKEQIEILVDEMINFYETEVKDVYKRQPVRRENLGTGSDRKKVVPESGTQRGSGLSLIHI